MHYATPMNATSMTQKFYQLLHINWNTPKIARYTVGKWNHHCDEPNVKIGEELGLSFRHDDYSIWFSLERAGSSPSSVSIERPVCTCDVHTACSRTRIGLYNDEVRSSLYLTALKKVSCLETKPHCNY